MLSWSAYHLSNRYTTRANSDALGASSPMTMPWSAILCCPGKEQDPLSQVLQLIRGMAHFPVSMSQDQLSHLPRMARGRSGGHLSLAYATTQQMSGKASSVLLTPSWPAATMASSPVLPDVGGRPSLLRTAAGRANAPTLMASGPALLQCLGGGQSYPFTALRDQPTLGDKPDQGPLLAFGGNRPTVLLLDHRPRQGPLWQHGPGPQVFFLTTLESPALPLFIVHAFFCFLFSSVSQPLTYLSS